MRSRLAYLRSRSRGLGRPAQHDADMAESIGADSLAADGTQRHAESLLELAPTCQASFRTSGKIEWLRAICGNAHLRVVCGHRHYRMRVSIMLLERS